MMIYRICLCCFFVFLANSCNDVPEAKDLSRPAATQQSTTSQSQATQPAPAKAPVAPSTRDYARRSLRQHAQHHAESVALDYDIDLKVDFDFFTYDGRQKLTLKNNSKRQMKSLYFFIYPNTPGIAQKEGGRNLVVRDIRVDGQAVKSEGVRSSMLKIDLNKPIGSGDSATIELSFKGMLYRQQANQSDLKKLALEQLLSLLTGHHDHAGGYGVFSVGEGIVSMALWHPILAAHTDDGWDVDTGTNIGDRSYFEVANFAVTLDVPDDVRVATTGVEQVERAKGTKRFFLASAVREFAIQMSEQYDVLSTDVGDVRVNSWFLREYRDVGHRVLKQAVDALRTFEADFGAYPYRELDVAQSPLTGGAGGVEFPGLVTVAHMFYAVPGTTSGLGQQHLSPTSSFLDDTREFVVAHEVAHQWWNAIVGSDSKQHPYLDEALANYSAVHYFERVHGPAAADRQKDLQLRLPWQMSRMTGAKDRPIDLPTKAFDNMVEYAAVVYAKGGLFYDAVVKRMGRTQFLTVLQEYYRDNTFKIARPKDLETRIVKGSTDPTAMQALHDRWLRGRHADQDIGSIKFTTLLSQFGGREMLKAIDPRLDSIIEHKGFDELMKVLSGALDADGQLKANVDYNALLGLVGEVLGARSDELQRLLNTAGRIVIDPSGIKPSDIVRDIGGVVAGDDADVRNLVNAFGGVLDAIEGMNEAQRQKQRQRQRRRPRTP